MEEEKTEQPHDEEKTEQLCWTCEAPLGKYRHSLLKFLKHACKDLTVGDALIQLDYRYAQQRPHGSSQKKSCICNDCYGLLGRQMSLHREVTIVDERWQTRTAGKICASPPPSPPPHMKRPKTEVATQTDKHIIITKLRQPLGFKRRAVNAIERGAYQSAMQVLVQNSAYGKRCFRRVVSKIIQKEVRQAKYSRASPLIHDDVTATNVANFSWKDVLKDAEKTMPTLICALNAALSSKVHQACSGIEDRPSHVQIKAGLMVAIILFSRFRRTCNFLPGVIGVQLWRICCDKRLMQCFNKMGLSLQINSIKARAETMAVAELDAVAGAFLQIFSDA